MYLIVCSLKGLVNQMGVIAASNAWFHFWWQIYPFVYIWTVIVTCDTENSLWYGVLSTGRLKSHQRV